MNAPRIFQAQAVRALALRGLKGYVESPAAYVALLVFYLLAGYLFSFPLFLVGQASLKSLMDFAPLLLTFLVPALTMGLLSEELRSGTFESLATLPLTDEDIVLGKFLSFAVLHLLAIAGLAFFPLALRLLVEPPAGLDWGETAGVLLALALQGLMLGAIGLFTSCLGRSQIVAFVTSFLIGFALFLLGKLTGFFPGALGTVAEFMGLDSHLNTLGKGVLDTRDLLYFASMTSAFLYLTAERLRARRF